MINKRTAPVLLVGSLLVSSCFFPQEAYAQFLKKVPKARASAVKRIDIKPKKVSLKTYRRNKMMSVKGVTISAQIPLTATASGPHITTQSVADVITKVETNVPRRAISTAQHASAAALPKMDVSLAQISAIDLGTLQQRALGSEELAFILKMDKGTLFGPKQTYAKFARIQATQAIGGEKIETVLADGTVETTNVANPGDWIVTNPGGEKYIVPGDKFAKKYEPASELGEGWYKPTGGNQQFVQINQDMQVLASWGETQFIKKGGFLNVTNPTDIYGVGEEEFHNTYKLVE
ncbi:MAG: hypothetical protein J6X06_00205 [Elusimicrobiaceae bacterium]|nr:hypothetical protein [Elusimicrobiaceae bacterium]